MSEAETTIPTQPYKCTCGWKFPSDIKIHGVAHEQDTRALRVELECPECRVRYENDFTD